MIKIVCTYIVLIATLVISAQPNDLHEQAQLYQNNEQFEQAIELYTFIASKNPADLDALFKCAHCYLASGELKKAITLYDHLLTIIPTSLQVLYNKGYAYKTMGDLDTAIEIYKQVLELNSEYDPAHLALGFAYLMNGDFENGWQQHSRYLKKSGKNGDALRELLQTNRIAGKRILVKPEGGLGDSFQYCRYLKRLHDMGAYIIALMQPELVPFFSACLYIDELHPSTTHVPSSYYDADATLMSLPAIFNDTEETLPKTVPYLFADEELTQYWKKKLDTQYPGKLKIGICWEVSVHNDKSRLPIARRRCPLEMFLLLKDIPNIQFFSLQKYDGLEELAAMPVDFPIVHYETLDESTGAFVETAALLKNLDYVISVDTAVEHLAAALGCKVLLILAYTPDWRWINKRTDSPWYPNTKIFKPEKPFEWDSVIMNIKEEILKNI